MKLAFLASLSALVAGTSARRQSSLRANQQMSLDVGEHMEMEVEGTSEFQGMSLVQDANFGTAFMGKWMWTSVPPQITNAEGKKVDGASSVVEFEFGIHFEPDVGPFVKMTYKFASTFTEMFPKAWAKVQDKVKGLTEALPKIKEAAAKAKSFKELAKGKSSFAADKWATFKTKLPKVAEMLEGFTVDAGIGGKAVGDFTPNFKFADSGNGGRPVFELEWKPKDANKFTSCCWNILPPAPAPVPGTCSFKDQGLHAQFQLGGVEYLKAIASAILPADKCDINAAPYKVGGKYVPAEIKKGVATNFDITKAAKVAPKAGGKLAAATMAAGKTIETIKKALGIALKTSTCTLRLEFRATFFTVGIENKLETGCWICKLGGNTGCKRSDGKDCA